jgi:hypothetical protein
MTIRDVGVLGFVLFLSVLGAADWSLRKWGSVAIRRRPRPAGRITVVFLPLCVVCGLLELGADQLWSAAPAAGIALLVLQYPAAVGVALGVDRAVRDRS